MKKVLSIEITDLVTRVCEMSLDKKTPKVAKSLIFYNPEATVSEGTITNTVVYGKELSDQLKRAGIKTRKVIFVYSNNRIMSREVTIPEMKYDKIEALIENERETYFPMDTSDHKFTFYVLEKLKKTRQQRIMIYAIPSELIGNYKILANELGFSVLRLDCSGNTISNWLNRADCRNMSLYLEINEKNTLFTITDKKGMALQRSMNFGSKPFEKLKELSPTMIRPLTANIANVLEYYNAKNRDAEVSKIYVGGAGSKLPGLKELVENEFMGIEIEIVETLPGVQIARKDSLMKERSTEFIACLGVVGSSINFNYGEEQKHLEVTLVRSILAAILVMVASGLIIMNGVYEYQDAQDRHNELKRELAELEKIKIEELEYEYIASDGAADEVVKMHNATETVNEHWNEIIGVLEEDSVSSMLLSSIASDQNGISFNIAVASKAAAAKMIMQLQNMTYEDGRKIFSEVRTSGLSESRVDDEVGASTVSISIQCSYKIYNAEAVSGSNDVLINTVKDGMNGVTQELSKELTDMILNQLGGELPVDKLGSVEY